MNSSATVTPNGAADGRVCVLVLGMHRSGTSALARTLNLLGCDLPKTLVPEAPGNEAGHWESAPVCQLNDALLDSAGTNWRDFEPVNPDWFRSPKAAEHRMKAIATLHEEFGLSWLYVLKDPRMCRIAGWWCVTIEASGARAAIIQIVRHPLEVAGSLKKRDNFDIALGVLLWLRNTLDAEHQTRGRARAFVSYDCLLENWGATLSRAQTAVGLSWPKRQSLVTPAIDQFLSDKLRHHRRPKAMNGEGANASADKWAADAFSVFERWAAQGEDPLDYPALDEIRTGLDAAGHAFARLVALQWYHQGQASRFEQQVAEAEKKSASAEARAAGAEQKAAALAADLAALKSRLAQTESALKQRSVESEETAEGLAAAGAQAAALKAEMADRFAEIAALTRLVQERETALAEIGRRLQARDEAGAAIGRLIAARASETISFQGAVAGIEQRLAEREQAFAKLDTLFADRAAEADDLRRALAIAAEERRAVSRKSAQAIRAITDAPLGPIFKRKELKRRAAMLAATGLFDADWYRRRYEDIAATGADPARHFVEFGAREGRFPNEDVEQSRKEG